MSCWSTSTDLPSAYTALSTIGACAGSRCRPEADVPERVGARSSLQIGRNHVDPVALDLEPAAAPDPGRSWGSSTLHVGDHTLLDEASVGCPDERAPVAPARAIASAASVALDVSQCVKTTVSQVCERYTWQGPKTAYFPRRCTHAIEGRIYPMRTKTLWLWLGAARHEPRPGRGRLRRRRQRGSPAPARRRRRHRGRRAGDHGELGYRAARRSTPVWRPTSPPPTSCSTSWIRSSSSTTT